MNTKTYPEVDRHTERRHLVNVYIGEIIRLQRNNIGMSVEILGQSLNVRFQQIHFYEIGDNQVTSSSLYYLSLALNVPISFFFDGIPDFVIEDSTPSQSAKLEFSDTANIFLVRDIREVEQEVRKLAEVFYKVEDKATRKGIVEFLKVLGRRP